MSTLEDKEKERRRLAVEVERFLANGGKIREIEFGASNDVIDYWGETHRHSLGDDDEILR